MVSSTRAAANCAAHVASSKGRILAIDYGRRRIGLAISDELGITAQPLSTIVRKNRRTDLKRLRELAKRNGVRSILIGAPVHLSGQQSEMAEEAARFAARVRKELGLPVELRDERLTSWEAEQVAKDLGQKENADVDALAAAVLLREYLDEMQNRKKSRQPAHVRCEK